ncbi:hypothetical protein TNCV_3038691 [Trichonephila clavipes]|nr:hypothetical protein TNCV_3038691 [Trichonephila clavipes]
MTCNFGFVDSVQAFLMLKLPHARHRKYVDKITEIIEVDRHVRSCSIAQELKIDHKTVLRHLSKVGFKKKLDGLKLNSDIYCHQLNCLKLVTDQKRPELASRRGVMFHQNNETPHTSVVTRQRLWELG